MFRKMLIQLIVQAQKRLKKTRLILWREVRKKQREGREDDEEKEPKVQLGAGSQGQVMKYVFQHFKLAEMKTEGQV